MKPTTRHLLLAAAVLLLYGLMQIVAFCCTLVAAYLPDAIADGHFPANANQIQTHAPLWGTMLLVAELVFIALLPITGLIRHRPLPARRPAMPDGWGLALIAFLLVAAGLSLVLSPLSLDDAGTTQLFADMMDNVPAVIGLCLVGPLAEELAYREGVQRHLLGAGLSPRSAIILTALVFALSHGNWSQGLPALVCGIFLSLLYARTGDIRLSLPAHVMNNTMSAGLFFAPSFCASLENLSLGAAIGGGLLISLAGAGLFALWWHRYSSYPQSQVQ